LQLLTEKINHLLEKNDRVVVAIDGNSSAGKSTLAAFLKESHLCSVISMDHFFLRPEQRTPERLSLPGGNIDHERFLDHVITPLRTGGSFTYFPYDCRLCKLGDPITVPANPLIVVEGAYSMHPNLLNDGGIYDISVFLQVDEAEQKRRLLLRNPDLYERFINEWVPMENKYFEHFKIADKCDFIFNNVCPHDTMCKGVNYDF